jgi:hypothetical protein
MVAKTLGETIQEENMERFRYLSPEWAQEAFRLRQELDADKMKRVTSSIG